MAVAVSLLISILLVYITAIVSTKDRDTLPQLHESSMINADVDSVLLKNGFHRSLKYKARVFSGNHYGLDMQSCSIMLQQKIPNDIYIDMYEMKNKEQFNGSKIIADHEFDVEKPSFEATEQDVLIYPAWYEIKRNLITFNAEIDVHARYQAAKANGEAAVIILQNANLYINCKSLTHERNHLTAPCYGAWTETCRWLQVNNIVKTPTYFEMKIPTGDKRFTYIVIITSLATSLLACILIVSQTLKNSDTGTCL